VCVSHEASRLFAVARIADTAIAYSCSIRTAEGQARQDPT
jgi:hypothetical protein